MASGFYQKLKWLYMLLGIGVVQLAFVAIANRIRVVEAEAATITEFQFITRQKRCHPIKAPTFSPVAPEVAEIVS